MNYTPITRIPLLSPAPGYSLTRPTLAIGGKKKAEWAGATSKQQNSHEIMVVSISTKSWGLNVLWRASGFFYSTFDLLPMAGGVLLPSNHAITFAEHDRLVRDAVSCQLVHEHCHLLEEEVKNCKASFRTSDCGPAMNLDLTGACFTVVQKQIAGSKKTSCARKVSRGENAGAGENALAMAGEDDDAMMEALDEDYSGGQRGTPTNTAVVMLRGFRDGAVFVLDVVLGPNGPDFVWRSIALAFGGRSFSVCSEVWGSLVPCSSARGDLFLRLCGPVCTGPVRTFIT